MPSRKSANVPESPRFSPEKAMTLLTQKLTELERLKGRRYSDAEEEENQWQHLMAEIIRGSFDPNSENHYRFQNAKDAGDRTMQSDFMPLGPSRDQPNFEARIKAFESLLKAMIKELELSLPDAEIKGVYEPGEEYAFYRDLSSLILTAVQDILIVDAYLDEQVFNLYVGKVASSASVRILSNKIGANVETVARMYAKNRSLEMRSSTHVHDRAIFLDHRGWVIGQSIKDAARKKPTYMIELSEPTLTASKDVHSRIWAAAIVVI